MDSQKWALLLKIIDAGSISAAATQSNYTISGISRIIAGLEQEVGFPLLVRNSRGVEPTKECELLIGDIRTFLHDHEQLTQKIANINGLQIGTLTIGTAYSSSYPLLTEQIVRFVQQYPNIKIEMLWGVSKPHSDMLWYMLQQEEMVAVVSANSKYGQQERFDLVDLINEPYIDIYPNSDSDSSRVLKENKLHVNTKFTTSDRFAAHEMVAAGLGITVINEALAIKRSDVRILPLNPPQHLTIGIACLPHTTVSTKRFIGFMQDAIRDSRN